MMNPSLSRQGGVVMMVSLLILLLIGFLAAAAYEGNLMQLRMADNDEEKSRDMQTALALVDAIVANPENFPLDSKPGDLLCPAGAEFAACGEAVVAIEKGFVFPADDWSYSVVRRGPAQISLPAMVEGRASSGRYYRGALFEISVSRNSGGGFSVVQGVMRRQVVPGH